MTTSARLTYEDLDWAELWQNAREIKGWSSKGPEAWDKKSESFASRNKDSVFGSLLLKHLPLDADTTVLDIGSGPGTLALPLAKSCRSVTALDFSGEMLRLLNERAAEERLTNIRTVNCAWEDNWDEFGVGKHDITIAARSMGVADLSAAIEKLIKYSNKYVFIADRISPTPFDPEAFRAVGRPFRSGPDYIYTLNMLYSMGIHPDMTVMQLENTLQFGSIEDALLSYSWMIKELTNTEQEKLKEYVRSISQIDENGEVTIIRNPPPRWVLIHWRSD